MMFNIIVNISAFLVGLIGVMFGAYMCVELYKKGEIDK